MQIFRENSDDTQTVAGYVSDLERRLQRALPMDSAEKVVRETQAHLSDRVDDLMDTGLTHAEAETIALSGSGPVKRFAHAATEAAYGGRVSTICRLVGRVAIVNILALDLCRDVLPVPLSTQIYHSDFFEPFIITLLLVIPLVAFGARRAQTRTYSIYLAIAAALMFIGGGLNYVPSATTPTVLWAGFEPSNAGPGQRRGDYRNEIAALKKRWVYGEVRLLEQGMECYGAGGNTGKPVPASLIHQGRFIVPDTKYGEYGAQNALLAFQEPAFMAIGKESWEQWVARVPYLPYHTVASQAEAERIWQAIGPAWLAGKRQEAANVNHQRQLLEKAQSAPLGFNLAAATYYSSNCLVWCAPLFLFSDLLLAHLGRTLWLVVRNTSRRRGLTA